MAKYKKKRARELQHDKFRDAAGRILTASPIALKRQGQGNPLRVGRPGKVVGLRRHCRHQME